MFRTYDDWKTTDPRDAQPEFTTCPVCRVRHYTHERCEEAEYVEPDPCDDRQ